jgi:hypothetical protein
MTNPPSGQQFRQPNGPDASRGEETAATQQFAAPPSEGSGAEQAAFTPDAGSQTAGFSTQMLDAHGAIAEALKGQSRAAGARSMSLDMGREGLGNVEGVALGIGEPGDGPPGEPTLTVFVAEPTNTESVRAAVVDGLGVQAARDVPLTVRRSGEFEAQPHTFRVRPAPGGVSVGHYRITAGTLGCLAVGRTAPRNSRLMILSNNHVLANSNDSVFGDSVIQPGRYDGGTHPNDQVAITERFVPLQYGGPTNYVDCATAWCWPDRVRRELIYPSGGVYALFRIGNAPQYATLGGVVGKTGRTTQLTQGRVVALNWAGWINYGTPGSAYFSGQFVVQGSGTNFSAPGDSGSVIWKWETGLAPVGLLFAGGGGYTIANPMPWVTYFLDINLYT